MLILNRKYVKNSHEKDGMKAKRRDILWFQRTFTGRYRVLLSKVVLSEAVNYSWTSLLGQASPGGPHELFEPPALFQGTLKLVCIAN